MMWSCGILQYVWAALKITIPLVGNLSCCKDRFVKTFSAAEEQQKHFIVISIWSLWYRINKMIHKGVKLSLQELLGFIKGYEHELRFIQETNNLSSRSMAKEIWRPPKTGVIKINFDATFKSSDKCAITAALARNSSGDIIGAETYLFEDVVDAFMVEARACERALIFAGMMGLRHLIMEGNSLTVIKSVKKQENDKLIVRPIINHITLLETQFDNVTYRFAPRLANEAAHILAIEGRRFQRFGFWVEGVTDAVKEKAMNDRLDWFQSSYSTF